MPLVDSTGNGKGSSYRPFESLQKRIIYEERYDNIDWPSKRKAEKEKARQEKQKSKSKKKK